MTEENVRKSLDFLSRNTICLILWVSMKII